MGMLIDFHKPVVAAALLVIGLSLPTGAAAKPAAELLAELQSASEATEANRVARELQLEWSRSGSAAMDMLLKRGRDALEAREYREAAEHFTALTDHAPGFAEGWHGRAMAFFHLELYGPAVADLERTLALNPDHFEAIKGLAVILERLNRLSDAYAAYEQVLALHPHHEGAMEAVKRLRTSVKGQEL